MKKFRKVIRSDKRTIVIYEEPTKAKAAQKEMRQRPFLVSVMGTRSYYIMPGGSILPIRHGAFWRFIKLIRPSSKFAV